MVIYTRCGIFISVVIVVCILVQLTISSNVSRQSINAMSQVPMTFVDQNIALLDNVDTTNLVNTSEQYSSLGSVEPFRESNQTGINATLVSATDAPQ